MTLDRDPPNIDSLLKGSQWEERVAKARVRREQVLAAKARGLTPDEMKVPTAAELETFAPRKVAPPAPAPQRAPRVALVLVGGIAIGAVLSGVAVWAF